MTPTKDGRDVIMNHRRAFGIITLTALIGWPSAADPDDTPSWEFRFDPYNNPDAIARIPAWPDWYRHLSFGHSSGEPNTLTVPVHVLRLRRREVDANGLPLMHGDMAIEVAASSGRFSSDSMELRYEVRIGATAWDAGVVVSPEFILESPASSNSARQLDRNLIGGLSQAQVTGIAESAPRAMFGAAGGEVRRCETLSLTLKTATAVVQCMEKSEAR